MADSSAHLVDAVLPTRLTPEDLDVITHTIARRGARYLEKAGYVVRDPRTRTPHLMPDEDDAMNGIIGTSTDVSDRTCRLAFGPNAGSKELTLKTVPATERPPKPNEPVSRQG